MIELSAIKDVQWPSMRRSPEQMTERSYLHPCLPKLCLRLIYDFKLNFSFMYIMQEHAGDIYSVNFCEGKSQKNPLRDWY